MAKTNLTVDFKSTSLYALKLVLLSDNSQNVLADLKQRITDAGDFYTDEAIVIDTTNLTKAPDWQALIKMLHDHQMHPIGIQTNSQLEAACADAGLAILDVVSQKPKAENKTKKSTAQDDSKSTPQTTDKNTETAVVNTIVSTKKTKVINRPLRSGQSIYAKDSDLVVIGMVSQGAEIIADGNIHVYGPLRGKAIAGASGDTQALILTTQLDPELLAIAGVYRVIETDLPDNLHDMPVKIELLDGTLKFERLK